MKNPRKFYPKVLTDDINGKDARVIVVNQRIILFLILDPILDSNEFAIMECDRDGNIYYFDNDDIEYVKTKDVNDVLYKALCFTSKEFLENRLKEE